MNSVIEIADEILRIEKSQERQTTPIRLNKLAYIAQHNHQAIHGRPLFPEDIEAWEYGPIIPVLYKATKTYGRKAIPHSTIGNSTSNLDPDTKAFLLNTVTIYAEQTDIGIASLIIADESPWSIVHERKGPENCIPVSMFTRCITPPAITVTARRTPEPTIGQDLPKYLFSAEKAVDGIIHLLQENFDKQEAGTDHRNRGKLSIRTALIACYFADKAHINEHGRPIFGATYHALPSGAWPVEIHDIIINPHSLWLIDADIAPVPFLIDENNRVELVVNGIKRTLVSLSETDKQALTQGFEKATSREYTRNDAERLAASRTG